MILVDTGYLVALAQRKDSLHSRAIAWTHSLCESLVITEYVLLETFNALSAPIDRPKAHALYSEFQSSTSHEIVYASKELLSAGLDLHRARSDKGWSLTDCISFCIMRARRISKALAYDEHFEQAGFEALLRKDPPSI